MDIRLKAIIAYQAYRRVLLIATQIATSADSQIQIQTSNRAKTQNSFVCTTLIDAILPRSFAALRLTSK